MLFFNRKPKTATLPPGWPSPYHNKCSQRDCLFPNSPQATKGVYQCRGIPGGFFCEGTYKISSSRAQETERYLKEFAMKRGAIHQEDQNRKRTVSDMRRPDPRRRDTAAVNVHPFDNRARPAYSHQIPPPSRAHGLARPHAAPPVRRPSCASHRPSQDQIQQEYMTDQIMMHLYPERSIHPRWI